jgi:MerR family transcriptional regulator/heat shock protein HspR
MARTLAQDVDSREETMSDHDAPKMDKDKPLYVISVAAELVDMHPQTLRLYERKGLIEPSRSAGKTRLYSQRNIEQLQEIRRLTQELGVNLAGVEEIIRLRQRLDEMQGRIEERIGSIQRRLQLEMRGARALPAPGVKPESDLDEETGGEVLERDPHLRRGLQHLSEDS